MNFDSMIVNGKRPKQVYLLTQNFPGTTVLTPQGNKQIGIYSFNPFQNLTIIKSNYNMSSAASRKNSFVGRNNSSIDEIRNQQDELEKTLILKQEDMTYVMSPVIVYCIEY